MSICIIPARGGSKRIPRKNIKEFCGKPMIAWSIEAAKESNCFDHIVVSTDDAEIAKVALQYGATVPFVRPANLSDDYTGTTAVVAHAVNFFIEKGDAPTHTCCLYTTAPFVTPESLQLGLIVLRETKSDYAFSATSYAFPIQRAIRVTANGRAEMFNPETFNMRSQDLEEAYHDAGQFYWGKSEAWTQERVIFGTNSTPVLLPRHQVQDIDTPEDWERAEWLFKAMQVQSSDLDK
ncbi:MAG: pseudaminic acid cytidylyltransferase [Kordiimonadaceae bacterium]|nr:pseudaminic acid cytidylyltransferase [Kordiimonadaceae bacterium]